VSTFLLVSLANKLVIANLKHLHLIMLDLSLMLLVVCLIKCRHAIMEWRNRQHVVTIS
jgi:hypothetical protein